MRRILMAAVLGTVWVPAVCGQMGNVAPVPPSWTQRPNQSPTPTVHNNETVEDPADRMRREQMAKLGAKRQMEARGEAERLLALATELKRSLDAAGKDTVPANTAGNTDEIVKLAKSIKAKTRPL